MTQQIASFDASGSACADVRDRVVERHPGGQGPIGPASRPPNARSEHEIDRMVLA
jgi:hypothetical protein